MGGRRGGDDAYCVLQLMHSKIRLNFVGPSQVRIRVQYCTRVRSWILESRISDTITNTGVQITRTGSFTQPGTGSPPPFILLPGRLEALAGLFRPSRRKPKCDRTTTRRHLLIVGVARDGRAATTHIACWNQCIVRSASIS